MSFLFRWLWSNASEATQTGELLTSKETPNPIIASAMSPAISSDTVTSKDVHHEETEDMKGTNWESFQRAMLRHFDVQVVLSEQQDTMYFEGTHTKRARFTLSALFPTSFLDPSATPVACFDLTDEFKSSQPLDTFSLLRCFRAVMPTWSPNAFAVTHANEKNIHLRVNRDCWIVSIQNPTVNTVISVSYLEKVFRIMGEGNDGGEHPLDPILHDFEEVVLIPSTPPEEAKADENHDDGEPPSIPALQGVIPGRTSDKPETVTTTGDHAATEVVDSTKGTLQDESIFPPLPVSWTRSLSIQHKGESSVGSNGSGHVSPPRFPSPRRTYSQATTDRRQQHPKALHIPYLRGIATRPITIPVGESQSSSSHVDANASKRGAKSTYRNGLLAPAWPP